MEQEGTVKGRNADREVTNVKRPRRGLPEELLPKGGGSGLRLSSDTRGRARSRARNDWTCVLARGARGLGERSMGCRSSPCVSTRAVGSREEHRSCHMWVTTLGPQGSGSRSGCRPRRLLPQRRGCPSTSDRARAPSAWFTPHSPGWSGHCCHDR